MSLRHYPCPACGAPMKIQGSHLTHAALREQYADCTNFACGASYLIRAEIVKKISPPSDLFADRVQFLPDCANPQDRIVDLAREFVGRPWHNAMSRDDLIGACREYLQSLLPDLAWRDAELSAARAIADLESAGLPRWSLSLDDSTGTCAIVRDADSGIDYAVSLKELVDFVLARRKALEGSLI